MREEIKNIQEALEDLYEVYGLSPAIYAEYNEHLMHILVNQMYTEGALAMINYISREISKLYDAIPDWDEVEYDDYMSSKYSM